MPETDELRTRIYVLARELGEEPKEVLERAQRLGLPVTTVLHSLDPDESSRVSESFVEVDLTEPGPEAEGRTMPYDERDPVTSVTIISLESQAADVSDDRSESGSRGAFGIVGGSDDSKGPPVEAGFSPSGSASSDEVLAERPGSLAEQAVGNDGLDETPEPLPVIDDGRDDVWTTHDDGHLAAVSDEVEFVNAEEEVTEEPIRTDSRAGSVVSIPGDPWGIEEVLEDAPDDSAPMPVEEIEVAEPVPAASDEQTDRDDVVTAAVADRATDDPETGSAKSQTASIGSGDTDREMAAGLPVVIRSDATVEPGADEVLEQPGAGELLVEPDADEVLEEPGADEVMVEPDTGEVMVEPDAGELLVEPDAGEVMVEPDAGEVMVEPDAGEVMVEPVADEVLEQPGAGELLVEPDTGEVVVEPDADEAIAEPDDDRAGKAVVPVDEVGDIAAVTTLVAPVSDDVAAEEVPLETAEPGDAAAGGARTWPWRVGVMVWALLIIAVAVVGAVLTATRLPDIQRAESDVIVRLSGFDFSEIDRQLDSYVVVAESETVIGPAARTVGVSPLDLRDAMTVGLIGESAVIRFGVEDSDPDLALAANTALVEQYLTVVNSPADDSLLTFIDSEVAEVEGSLLELDATLNTLAQRRSDSAARRAGLLATQETLRGRLVSLYTRRTDIATGVAVTGVSLSAIQAEIDDVQEELDSVTGELEEIESGDAADEAAETQALAEQVALRSDLARLRDRRVGLGIDQLDEARARVLTSPHMIAGSVTPSVTRGAAFGLAIGLILAVAFVVIVVRLRRPR